MNPMHSSKPGTKVAGLFHPQPPIQGAEKILLIKLRAIGDVVMSTVVLDNLRAHFPHAQIDFLTEAFCRDLLIDHPVVRRVFVLPKKDRSVWLRLHRWKESLHLLMDIRREKYDLVFDFFGNPRSAWLTLFSGASHRIGYDFRLRSLAYNVVVPSRADQLHEVEWHLDALSAIGVPIVARNPRLVVSSDCKIADHFWTQNRLAGKRIIGFNFSGGWPAKRWPLEKFAELAMLLQRDFAPHFVLIWGPGEKTAADQLQKMIGSSAIALPPTDLKELGCFLPRLDLLVSTDSGPMHIAAALGTPCVGLFGPTHPQQQGPYGEPHEVVCQNELSCLGCNRTDCPDIRCMLQLAPSRVLEAVHRCVKKNRLWAS